MKLLVLDFETQSDDPATTNATEIGAALINLPDPSSASHTVERLFSQLIYDESYPPQTQEIVDITGITDEMLTKGGVAPLAVFEALSALVSSADYCVAHNAAFDRGVYEACAKRLGLAVAMPGNGWICTVQDVPWPKKYKCKKLSHLAYDHGIMVDPATLHRAINDVELLVKLLLGKYRMSDVIAYRDMPWAYLRAVVEPPWVDGGVSTGQAKKLGFSWEKIWGCEVVYPKGWVCRVKEDQLEAMKAKCPFKLMRFTPGK